MTKEAAILAAVGNGAMDGIVPIDESGRIVSLNPAASKLVGYAPEEVIIGHSVDALMPEPHRSEHEAYLRNYLTTREPKIIGTGRQVERRRKDGCFFPIGIGVAETQSTGAVSSWASSTTLTQSTMLCLESCRCAAPLKREAAGSVI